MDINPIAYYFDVDGRQRKSRPQDRSFCENAFNNSVCSNKDGRLWQLAKSRKGETLCVQLGPSFCVSAGKGATTSFGGI